MTFSFSATPDFDFLTQFAQYLQVPVHDDQVTLPEHLGQGYVRKLQFGVDFRLTIHCYELHEDLVVRRQAASGSSDQITLFFYNNEQPLDIAFADHAQVRFSQRDESAVQLTSNDLSSTIRFPAQHAVRYLVVALKTPRLKALLAGTEPHPVLSALTAEATFVGWQLSGTLFIPPPLRSAVETAGHLVAAMLLIALAGVWPPVRRAFASRPLQWLGLVSFSLYLVHEPVLLAVVRLAPPLADAACAAGLCPSTPAPPDGVVAGSALADLGPLGIAVTAAVAIALSLAVAAAFHRLVESRAHRFAQRLRSTPQQAQHDLTGRVP